MAINRFADTNIPTDLSYASRVILSKNAVLKNQGDEKLHQLLGRVKALLGDDEVLVIVKADAFRRSYLKVERDIRGPMRTTAPAELLPQRYYTDLYTTNTEVNTNGRMHTFVRYNPPIPQPMHVTALEHAPTLNTPWEVAVDEARTGTLDTTNHTVVWNTDTE